MTRRNCRDSYGRGVGFETKKELQKVDIRRKVVYSGRGKVQRYVDLIISLGDCEPRV